MIYYKIYYNINKSYKRMSLRCLIYFFFIRNILKLWGNVTVIKRVLDS